MTDQHPITPPPELVRKWQIKLEYCTKRADREAAIAKIFQLGADQELEACCEWFVRDWTDIETADKLRAARRPKPPSLKEQALQALANADGADHPVVATVLTADQHALIRKALEQLND